MSRVPQRTNYKGNKTALKAIQHGIAAKKLVDQLPANAQSIASAQLVSQLMQDPEVVNALANLAAAGVHVSADIIEQSLPDLQRAAVATGTSLKAATVNAVQGVIDAIPIADDIEAVGQEAIAAADLGGAVAKAGTGILYSTKDIVSALGNESSIIDQRIKLLQNAANAAMDVPSLSVRPRATLDNNPKVGGKRQQRRRSRRFKKRRSKQCSRRKRQYPKTRRKPPKR